MYPLARYSILTKSKILYMTYDVFSTKGTTGMLYHQNPRIIYPVVFLTYTSAIGAVNIGVIVIHEV